MTNPTALSSIAEGLTIERWREVLADLDASNQHLTEMLEKPVQQHYDVVIVGSGPGGGTLAWALRGTGLSILLVERGDFLPQEEENWNSDAVIGLQRYANSEEWIDHSGIMYQPHMYHYVGGMTKLYAGTLMRLRVEDFGEIVHADGVSPPWPVDYLEMEPWYAAAERLYLVHGESGHDPTDPPRSTPYPYPPLPLAPEIAEVRARLLRVGLHPFPLPQGLALGDRGRCVYCSFCDSHPCRVLARADTELCCIRPALESATVTLLTRTTGLRILSSPDGRRVTAVELQRQRGERLTISADTIVVSCGAVHTPALLIRSATDAHPHGLANRSRMVGANYMRHLSTMLLAENPRRELLAQNHYWKTVGFHDFYLDGSTNFPFPLGAVQITGNYHSQMSAFMRPNDGRDAAGNTSRAGMMIPFFLLTEDLPIESNRVSLEPNGQPRVSYRATNVSSHQVLIKLFGDALREAGYGSFTVRSFLNVAGGGGYHHCGTARFGDDPASSVLDRNCRAHDIDNLYVVDACFFPSSSAANPVLTIAANALRVGAYLSVHLN